MNVNGIINGSYMPVQKGRVPKLRNGSSNFQNSFNGVHALVMGGLCSRGLADMDCIIKGNRFTLSVMVKR